MADNISTITGEASFFSVKEIPWHGLGKILDACPTSKEAIIQAGLNYEVRLAKLQAIIDSPVEEERVTMDIHDRYATYRADINYPFDIVRSRYTPVQNSEAFAFFDQIVGEDAAIYETAGSLGCGEIVFITAKLPSNFIVVGDDIINKYLLFTTTHDGSGSITAMFTPIRVVCNNTLNMALSSDRKKLIIRHTKNAHTFLEEGAKLMGIVNTMSNDLGELLKRLTRYNISDENIIRFINKIFLTKPELDVINSGGDITAYHKADISTKRINIIHSIIKYTFSNTGGQDMKHCRNTLYGVYNGISGYYQNVKEYNSNGKYDAEKRMKTILQGTGYEVMQQALDLAYQCSIAVDSGKDIITLLI